MPDILPTINNEPAQGIQAQLDTIYLWNQDVANELIEQINELLEELGELSNISGTIKPYGELEAPVRQYLPMYYGDGVYVASEDMDSLPLEPDLTKWILIASKGTSISAGTGIVIENDTISVSDSIVSGAAAGATAVQPASLGSAAYAATTDFATAAQGAKADTAAQPGDVSSAISTHNVAADAHSNIISPIATSVSGIEEKIPAQASSSNQLADKNFVNSSIATNTANFIGTFNSVAELEAYSGPVTNNDYAYVIRTDASGNTLYDRYKYTDATTPASWEYEYTLNNSSFTADQWAAINSHATEASIGQISTNQQNISSIQTTIGSFGDVVTHNANEFATAAQGAKADTAVQPGDLATVATTGNYNDLINKPDLPTSVVPQYTTMPIASAANVGEIAQYAGETIPDVPAAAVATQTVGSGLSDLSVNVDTFIETEQPTQAESVDFVADVVPDTSVVEDATAGLDYTFDGQTVIDYFNSIWGYHNPSMDDFVWGITYAVYTGGGTEGWVMSRNQDGSSVWSNVLPDGLTINSTPNLGDYIAIRSTMGSTAWTKNGTTVDLASYGISYTGTPVDGDTISVAYTPFVAGIINGYFYKSSVEYSDPVATISQTVGSGLSDLAVNVETFIETEQPTQDETVSFVADVPQDTMNFSTQSGDITFSSSDPNAFKSYVMEWSGVWYDEYNNAAFVYGGGDTWNWGPQSGGMFRTFSTDELTTHGISIVGTPNDNDTVFYSYITGETSWTKGGTTVDLAEYGISYSGTPVDGDTLTVDYTAPAPIGYYWNQTDVQPSSGSGGDSGIEWKTVMDVEPGVSEWLYPVYDLGNLPDGTYEFYYQFKCSTGDYPTPMTVKCHLTLSTQGDFRQYSGYGAYVLNGDFSPDGNFDSLTDIKWINLLRINNGSVVLSNGDWTLWASDMPSYYSNYTREQGKGVFKLSAVKNIDTGAEIIAQGTFYLDSEKPSYEPISGSIRVAPLVRPPYIPDYNNTSWYSTNDINATKRIRISGNYTRDGGGYSAYTIGLSARSGNDEFRAYLYADAGCGARQEIIVATGVFSTWRVSTISNTGEGLALCWDNANTTYTDSVRLYAGFLGSDKSIGAWTDSDTSLVWVPFPLVKSGYSAVFDAVTENTFGAMLQYTGDTNASYTNGYFYKATGTLIHVPSSLVWNDIQPSDCNVTVDCDSLISALASLSGWSQSTIKNYFTQGYSWSVLWDVDNEVIERVEWGAYGSIDDSAVLSCFTVSVASGYTGTVTIYLNDSVFVDAHTVIQNGHWEQVDVQPGGSSLPSQTGNAGKFLTTDGTDASWSDKPLVNKATGSTDSVTILGVPSTYNNSMNIGRYSEVGNQYTLSVGQDSSANGRFCTALGFGARTIGSDERNTSVGYAAQIESGSMGAISMGVFSKIYSGSNYGIAIGISAGARAHHAIQIGCKDSSNGYINSDANTFKVGNDNGNFEIMSADGTIPEARLADTTNAAQGQVLTLDSNLNAVWANAGGGGGSVPTLTWYTVSTAGNTLTIADTSSANLVKVYKNGLLLQPTEDYTISGTTLTTVAALVVGDKITTEVF